MPWIYLWINQEINFVVDDRVKTFFFEVFDGVLTVVVITPAEQNQTMVFRNVDLGDVTE